MISYAQNLEDVLLNRIFGGINRGFYVDIGAYDPEEGSVTKHFYDMGWSGVNVEPASIFNRLNNQRARDTNLNVAISDRSGTMDFYEHPEDPGTSTLCEALHSNLQNRIHERRESTVKTRSLTDVLSEYAPDVTIDFLKVDVEGHEFSVIKGCDWARFRPRVVLVEATLPYSNEPCHQEWEPLLLDANYHFAFFDGLNRYYVRGEDGELLGRFHSPVNVLDNYEPAKARLQTDLSQAKEAAEKTDLELARLQKEVDKLELSLSRSDTLAQRLEEHSVALASQLATVQEKADTAQRNRDQALVELESVQAENSKMRDAAVETQEELGKLNGEIARLHETIQRVNEYAEQAGRDRDLLRSELESVQLAVSNMTHKTGRRSLAVGLWIARTVHRIGRRIGVVRASEHSPSIAAFGQLPNLESQLQRIDQNVQQVQAMLETTIQDGRGVSDVSKSKTSDEMDRLVILLLKLARAGQLAGQYSSRAAAQLRGVTTVSEGNEPRKMEQTHPRHRIGPA